MRRASVSPVVSRVTGGVFQAEASLVALCHRLLSGGIQQFIVAKLVHAVEVPVNYQQDIQVVKHNNFFLQPLDSVSQFPRITGDITIYTWLCGPVLNIWFISAVSKVNSLAFNCSWLSKHWQKIYTDHIKFAGFWPEVLHIGKQPSQPLTSQHNYRLR